jgi:CRISPR type III-A-associated RAMP protein Csm5
MATLKLTTLTPVHVGSGNQLGINTEALYFPKAGITALIDEQKVLQIMGEDKIQEWVDTIRNGRSLLEELRKQKSDLQAGDIARELIPGYLDPGNNNEEPLRENVRIQNYLPYIPGSSIKGALRTAFFAQQVLRQEQNKTYVRNIFDNDDKYPKIFKKANAIEGAFMGKKPEKDLFRLLKVGDAYFERTHTGVARVYSQGQSNNGEWPTKSYPINLEYIPANESASFSLSQPDGLMNYLQAYPNKNPFNTNNLDQFQAEKLFQSINQATKRTLQQELAKIKGQEPSDAYRKKLERIEAEIDKLDHSKSCILRMGWGSGWEFITGGWQEKTLNGQQLSEVERAVHNQRMGTMLPKSRRYLDRSSESPQKSKQSQTAQSENENLLAGFNVEDPSPVASEYDNTSEIDLLGFIRLDLVDNSSSIPRFGDLVQRKYQEQIQLFQQHSSNESSSAGIAEEEPINRPSDVTHPPTPAPYRGKLKSGAEVPARVVGQEGKFVKVELLLSQRKQHVSFRYPAGLAPDTYVVVRLGNVSKKGQVQEVTFMRYWQPA